jgi:hypothetical protein
MTKHTPAPWHIEKCQCGHEKCHTYGLENVGTFYQGSGFDLADALLVAAAPELLQFALAFEEVIKGAGHNLRSTSSLAEKLHFISDILDAWNSNYSAIEKAKGE